MSQPRLFVCEASVRPSSSRKKLAVGSDLEVERVAEEENVPDVGQHDAAVAPAVRSAGSRGTRSSARRRCCREQGRQLPARDDGGRATRGRARAAPVGTTAGRASARGVVAGCTGSTRRLGRSGGACRGRTTSTRLRDQLGARVSGSMRPKRRRRRRSPRRGATRRTGGRAPSGNRRRAPRTTSGRSMTSARSRLGAERDHDRSGHPAADAGDAVALTQAVGERADDERVGRVARPGDEAEDRPERERLQRDRAPLRMDELRQEREEEERRLRVQRADAGAAPVRAPPRDRGALPLDRVAVPAREQRLQPEQDQVGRADAASRSRTPPSRRRRAPRGRPPPRARGGTPRTRCPPAEARPARRPCARLCETMKSTAGPGITISTNAARAEDEEGVERGHQLPREAGLALLEEGGHPLACVRRREEGGELVALVLEVRRVVARERLVQRLLRAGERDRALRREERGALRDEARRSSGAQSACTSSWSYASCGAQRAAGEDELLRDAEPRERARAAACRPSRG